MMCGIVYTTTAQETHIYSWMVRQETSEGIDHSKDEELYEEFMKTNYPNDWKNLQENQHYQDKKREEIATKEYQKALKEIKEKGYMEV